MTSFSKKVDDLLNAFLDERPDLFLVKSSISPSNDITVIIDGDQSVSVQDCLDASRAIENNLDREEEDFSLKVMSPGLTEPLKMERQYKKNLRRELSVTLQDGSSIEGELIDVNQDGITLMLRYRKKKDIGKGKVDVEESKEIPYSDIDKALVKLKY